MRRRCIQVQIQLPLMSFSETLIKTGARSKEPGALGKLYDVIKSSHREGTFTNLPLIRKSLVLQYFYFRNGAAECFVQMLLRSAAMRTQWQRSDRIGGRRNKVKQVTRFPRRPLFTWASATLVQHGRSKHSWKPRSHTHTHTQTIQKVVSWNDNLLNRTGLILEFAGLQKRRRREMNVVIKLIAPFGRRILRAPCRVISECVFRGV